MPEVLDREVAAGHDRRLPEPHRSDPRPDDLRAYPTLTQAAHILDVRPSTLSRRRDLHFEPMGREKRLTPATVMELAAYYRRRSQYEVAESLVQYARERAPEMLSRVEEEVDSAFSDNREGGISAQEFLEEARRSLPSAVYDEVCRLHRASSGRRARGVSGADRDEQ